jgi:Zn-dependent membrane protease YugP
LVIRNLAVPLANFGGSFGVMLIFAGIAMSWILLAQFSMPLIWAGIIGFGCVAAFQLVNLPVEFDASNRAKRLLAEYGIVGPGEMTHVNSVLNAAAWTYVAATLQTVLTLLYYLSIFAGGRND